LANIAVFVDDHDRKLMVSFDHSENILTYIHQNSLKPIADSSQLDVQALFKIHVLGLADRELVREAYIDYARKQKSGHPQVVFSAVPTLFQYASAPWTAILQL
jgi:hypothetical protein